MTMYETTPGRFTHSCGYQSIAAADNYCGGCGMKFAGNGILTLSSITKHPATEGDWSCPKCGYINPRDDGDCRICMTSKPS